MEKVYFDWLECTVSGSMLTLSVLIGIYFGFIKKGPKTVKAYIGGNNLGLLPITVSLITSSVFGGSLIGIPSEIYFHGTQYMMNCIGSAIAALGAAFLILPVLYNIQMTSIFEYLEMRFNSTLRRLVSVLYIILGIAQTTIKAYVPALILNQVSGVHIETAAIIFGSICIFYTAFGGLKAVLWTDTLQGFVIMVSISIVVIHGFNEVGGIVTIWNALKDGERLEFFKADPNPTTRMTIWTSLIGHSTTTLALYGLAPSNVQRYKALPTLRKAQWSIFITNIGCSFINECSAFIGMVVYTKYRGCDPFTVGLIEKQDQILPFFIMITSRSTRGLAGIFIAGSISAALGTMSTNLNTMSGSLYTDLMQPYLKDKNDQWGNRCLKIIVLVFGGICLLFVNYIGKLGSVLEMGISLVAMTNAAILGIFILGMLCPRANSIGAMVGGISSFTLLLYIFINFVMAVQSGAIVNEVKPLSTDSCPFNVTTNRFTPTSKSVPDVFPLFKLSVFYYHFFGCLVTVVVGFVVSLLTGSNQASQMDKRLFSPLVHRFIRSYDQVPTAEHLSKYRNDEVSDNSNPDSNSTYLTTDNNYL